MHMHVMTIIIEYVIKIHKDKLNNANISNILPVIADYK